MNDIIKQSVINAANARKGMILKKGRWVWPETVPQAIRRQNRPTYGKEYRSTKAGPKTNGSIERQFCDCGQPATIKKNNAKICQRCHEIETRMGHMILKN